ncbi:MAG TPA: GNAT family N-acetyltransferase [Vicinamibacterales bacterium]|nr:GNAT family N-acetyltransferase [Vicinamibacterales bacterium]
MATSADREFLATLAHRLADFDRPEWRSQKEIADGDRRALFDALDHPQAGTELFVAELDGVRAGCLLMWTLEDYFSQQWHAHVSVIAVTKDAEGAGVGRALMAHAEEWARAHGQTSITLSVFEGNRRAQALYQRAGYTTEMRRMIKRL